MNSCFSADFGDLNKLPDDTRRNIENFFKKRLGSDYYERLEFKSGYVISDKPIEIERTKNEKSVLALLGQDKEKTDCDTILSFPIYSVAYELEIPEIGIGKVGLNLMIDKNYNVIKEVEFPQAEFTGKIIPIDSVHSELIRRKIPTEKLNIDLWYNKRSQSFVWSTSTLIREGSIFGPSCFPEMQYHFKMDAATGKITDYEYRNNSEYFAERY